MLEWHIDILIHIWWAHLVMFGVTVCLVTCSWIVWDILWHSLSWIGGLFLSCSPNPPWCQCTFVCTILLSQFNFPPWCSWGVLRSLRPRILFQNCRWQEWTVLVSNRVSKTRVPICFVGSLSSLVSFPEAHFLIIWPVVNRTCRDLLGCEWNLCHPLFSWVDIYGWFNQGFI